VRISTSFISFDIKSTAGNLIQDNHKKITGIEYNILNLPYKITVIDGGVTNSITFIYEAAEIKQTIIQNGSNTKKLDYAGSFYYETEHLATRSFEVGTHQRRQDSL